MTSTRHSASLTALLFAVLLTVALSAPITAHCQPINLSTALRQTSKDDADIFTGDSTSRPAYNTQLSILGSAIFADDAGIYKTIQTTNSPHITKAAEVLNHAGDLKYVAPALAMVYAGGGYRDKQMAWRSGVAIVKAGALGTILKVLVGRKRPDGADGGDGDTFRPLTLSGNKYESFPSGHTLVAFSTATVWAMEFPRERYIAYTLASGVGLARIYTHNHWPADVFWGAVLGFSQGRAAVRGSTNLFTLQF